MGPRILVCLLLLVTSAALARGETIVLPAVRDNTLFEDAQGDTSNGLGPSIFCGRISQGRIRRALVMFDLSLLPTSVVIDSVGLELHMAIGSDLESRVLALHRVVAGWSEGASYSSGGQGAPAEPGDATWLHASYPNSYWLQPGGDFVATPSDTVTVQQPEGDYVWRSEAMTEDVRGWIQQTTPNYGWILLGDESVPNTARRFDSRESPATSYRPRLVIHYSVPTDVVPMTWGKIKIRYR
ncbi:MAG TPA: DNRLRE domain-containing protein [Candidatus Eisenbacteria bacterium]|nr:DNRLRE domain-containing protein [Candidatus Eisenbacteria bacterium]